MTNDKVTNAIIIEDGLTPGFWITKQELRAKLNLSLEDLSGTQLHKALALLQKFERVQSRFETIDGIKQKVYRRTPLALGCIALPREVSVSEAA